MKHQRSPFHITNIAEFSIVVLDIVLIVLALHVFSVSARTNIHIVKFFTMSISSALQCSSIVLE